MKAFCSARHSSMRSAVPRARQAARTVPCQRALRAPALRRPAWPHQHGLHGCAVAPGRVAPGAVHACCRAAGAARLPHAPTTTRPPHLARRARFRHLHRPQRLLEPGLHLAVLSRSGAQSIMNAAGRRAQPRPCSRPLLLGACRKRAAATAVCTRAVCGGATPCVRARACSFVRACSAVCTRVREGQHQARALARPCTHGCACGGPGCARACTRVRARACASQRACTIYSRSYLTSSPNLAHCRPAHEISHGSCRGTSRAPSAPPLLPPTRCP